jgi:Phasin protein
MQKEQTIGTGRGGDAIPMKQFANLGQQTFDKIMALQKGYLETMQEINQQWATSMNAEATLASEFFAKLTAAKSIPDAVSACQECGSRQMEILADQNRRPARMP